MRRVALAGALLLATLAAIAPTAAPAPVARATSLAEAPVRLPSDRLPNTPGSITVPPGFRSQPPVTEAVSVAKLRALWVRAGAAYGIPWQVLAAINRVESDLGRNMGPSGAGAVGWMQFMPSTWLSWGVDADGDRVADPWSSADAIHAAARYLAASGGRTHLEDALLAYNHAGWYADRVLELAGLELIGDSLAPAPLPDGGVAGLNLGSASADEGRMRSRLPTRFALLSLAGLLACVALRLRPEPRRRRAPSRRLGAESGFTLVELLVTMVILTVVVGALTGLFVSGSNAQIDLNNRFQAQSAARLALDKLRREVHCASGAGVTASALTLTLPAQCPTAQGQVTWCTLQVGVTPVWELYRKTGATCDTGGVRWAQGLSSGSVFSLPATPSGSLAAIHVDLPVTVSDDTYRLVDDLVLRNGARA